MRDQVTFCIKTIHRPHCCAALVRSIYQHYGDDRPLIHVVDDGMPELRFSVACQAEAAMVDRLIETEYDIGLSAGRNHLLDSGDTPIVVFTDDDHLVTEGDGSTTASSSDDLGPRPDWWPEDWPWPPKPEEPVVIEAVPPIHIWPRLPPDHPYHVPPGHEAPHNLPPGPPGEYYPGMPDYPVVHPGDWGDDWPSYPGILDDWPPIDEVDEEE